MGGGQPIKSSKIRREVDVRKLRADGLYSIDEKSQIRKSHENPVVRKLYEEYLEKPGSYRAHKLLHTHYTKKDKYKIWVKWKSDFCPIVSKKVKKFLLTNELKASIILNVITKLKVGITFKFILAFSYFYKK